ncbi:hypothetical protein ACLIA0_02060 [Bacillaceae bacterium W0354]
MIVQVKGKVKYPITLDPTVWIFDDRKILLDDYLKNGLENNNDDEKIDQDQPWNRNEYQQKLNPPINRTLSKFEREQVLENSYVMPINEFLPNAEPNDDVKSAIIHTSDGEKEIAYSELMNSVLLFALNGKPLKNDGPVHLYYGSEPNVNNPIKGVNKITLD